MSLPLLDYGELAPTRDRLRDAALVLGKLQQMFLPVDPHDWQHGLEVNMRGLLTQGMNVKGHETRASLDLVKHKLRLGDARWKLEEYDGPELYNNVRVWLESHGIEAELAQPKFGGIGKAYDREQAGQYAEALWWLDRQFQVIKAGLKGGLIAPILLYPHHFDLSLVQFPHNDERQRAIGWSTGDETVTEPYLYLTAYPEADSLDRSKLPPEARWQTDGFTGAVLPYAALAKSSEPAALLQAFASLLA